MKIVKKLGIALGILNPRQLQFQQDCGTYGGFRVCRSQTRLVYLAGPTLQSDLLLWDCGTYGGFRVCRGQRRLVYLAGPSFCCKIVGRIVGIMRIVGLVGIMGI